MALAVTDLRGQHAHVAVLARQHALAGALVRRAVGRLVPVVAAVVLCAKWTGGILDAI